MRFFGSACLAVAALAALAPTSSAASKKEKAAKKEAERLKTAAFNIVLVVRSDGSKCLEVIEPQHMRERRKKLMQAYQAEAQLWCESKALFKKARENRGRKFAERVPISPGLKPLQSRIRGQERAAEVLKMLEEKWLKPLLEKEKARAKAKAEEAAKKNPRGNPDFLPKGNQVMNGGFEERKSKSSLADGWVGGQWGGTGKYSVRRSKMNPREGGGYSVVIYSMSEGARPGVSTTVKLSPARYEVRFWACSDPDKTARIQASFGGSDLQEHTVNEEWRQFKEIVTVEKRSFRTKLLIWTMTNGVRIYLDDVEVEAVRPAADKAAMMQ